MSKVDDLEKMLSSAIKNQTKQNNYTKADIQSCRKSDSDIIETTTTSIDELELAIEEVYEMIQEV